MGSRKPGTVPQPKNRGLSLKGKVVSLNVSNKKGEKKQPVESFDLVKDKGVMGDVHFGSERQVSMLPLESIEKMKADGLDVDNGSFAENITVKGLSFPELSKGTKIRLGNTLVEITQFGKECHNRCSIYEQAGYCVMPEDGVFVKVIKSGKIFNGDKIEVLH